MSTRPLYVGPLLHLRTVAAFEGLSQRHLAALAQEAEEVVVQRGQSLLDPGEEALAFHVVVDGRVTVRRPSGTVEVGPGGEVGFLEVLAPGPSGSEARAADDTLALRIEDDVLREICERHFPILHAFVAYLGRGLLERPPALACAVGGGSEPWPETTAEPLDRVDRILALHRSPVFPSRSMDALAELARHLGQMEVPAGQVLWRPGEEAESFLLVCQGGLRHLADGSRPGLEVGPGGTAGLPDTLAGGIRDREVVATGPTVALTVGVEPFLDVLEDHFEMAYAFAGRLARCLLDAESP